MGLIGWVWGMEVLGWGVGLRCVGLESSGWSVGLRGVGLEGMR